MPWEITVFNGTIKDPRPLGSREEVIAAFADSLPGVFLEQPPTPPAELLAQMPAILREAMIRPRLKACFDVGDLSFEFCAEDEPLLRELGVYVRGNGDPIPVLAALCLQRGWSVRNDSDGSIVELTSASGSSDWERFRVWRDRAIQEQADMPDNTVT